MNNNFINYDNNPTEEFAGKQYDSRGDYSADTFSGEAFTGDSGYSSPSPSSEEPSPADEEFKRVEEVVPEPHPESKPQDGRRVGSDAPGSDGNGPKGSYGSYGGPSGGNGGGYQGGDYRQDWDRYRNGGYADQAKKKSHKGLLIFLIILIIAAGAILGTFLLNKYVFHKEAAVPVVEQDHLAQVNISGTIDETTASALDELYNPSSYNHSFIMNTIGDLEKESSCKGIILYLNTPGGSVYATDQVYLKLLEYKQKTGNPVYAVMGPQCCSGGYYISCAADRIYANRNTTTGSIGVTFGTQLDISGLLEKYGVKTTTITSGANKSMGSMYEPMTEEQRAIYQSIIDEAYAQFTAIVAEGRKMTAEQVWPLADGRIYTAAQAKNCGLIDEVYSYEESIDVIKKETGVKDVYTYSYISKVSLKDIILGLSANLSPSSKTENSDLAKAIALAEEASYSEPYYIVNK